MIVIVVVVVVVVVVLVRMMPMLHPFAAFAQLLIRRIILNARKKDQHGCHGFGKMMTAMIWPAGCIAVMLLQVDACKYLELVRIVVVCVYVVKIS